MNKLWQVLAALAPHTPSTLSLFHPVIRQSFCCFGSICGPRIGRTQVDEARCALVVSLLIAQFTRHVADAVSLTHPPYAIVFLPAFTAEAQRYQDILPIAWV